jgi:DUF4097 and DUF4098 domain-containing protein YvlB
MFKQLFGILGEHVEELEEAVEGTDLAAVEVETKSGSIALRGTDQGQVVVHAEKRVRAPSQEKAKAFAQEVIIRIERKGDRLRIHTDHPRPPLGYSVSVSYDVTAPGGVDADLHTSSGGIRVEAIEGAVKAKTSSGGIRLQGAARMADLHTSSGGIHAHDIAGAVRARTSSGGIEVQGGSGYAILHSSSGGVKAHIQRLEESGEFSSNSGAIHVEVEESTAPIVVKGASGSITIRIGSGIVPVDAKTSSGSVHVALPAGFAGQLDASTNSGRVHCDLPLSDAQSTRKRVTGKIGEGGEALVKLNTSSGSVHVGAG